MDEIPVICTTCGGDVSDILAFRELMALRMVEKSKGAFNMNQFTLNDLNVQDILEAFGYGPYDDCCTTVIQRTRLPTDLGIVAPN